MFAMLNWSPALAWAILIFFMSHQSSPPLSDASPDWSLHILAYLILALASTWGITSRFRKELTFRRALTVLVLALVYAVSDEFHQSFVPERHPSAADLLADALGAGACVCTLYFFGIRQRARGAGRPS